MQIELNPYAEENKVHMPHLITARSSTGKRQVTSSDEWITYYTENAESQRQIPWQNGLDAPREEVEKISASLQAWQLGETSDGSHLMRAAKAYVHFSGDQHFLSVASLFIKEEQRHGEMLGKFLDLAGYQRVKRNWGDSLFRLIRYSFENMEVWVTPVIMVETMALLYYRAIHDATRSSVLQAICLQILHDEVAHIRFQYERLAIIHRKRSRIMYSLTMSFQRLLFAAITIAVWGGHRQAFTAGGHTFLSYWIASWKKMGRVWRWMNPENFEWRN